MKSRNVFLSFLVALLLICSVSATVVINTPQQNPSAVIINATGINFVNNSEFFNGFSLQTFNQTFIQPYANPIFNYNHTSIVITLLNGTYGKFWYNQTYGGSTFNTTYNTLLNQSCPAGKVVNGTLINGTFVCIAASSGGNQSFNESYTDGLYLKLSGLNANQDMNLGGGANYGITGNFFDTGSIGMQAANVYSNTGLMYIGDTSNHLNGDHITIDNLTGSMAFYSKEQKPMFFDDKGNLYVPMNITANQSIFARNLCYANGTNSSGQNCSRATGGGTPGGSAGQLQYNNGGSFGGIANTISSGTTVTFFNGSAAIWDDGFGNGFVLQSPTQNLIGAYDNVNNYPLWEINSSSFALFTYANRKITYSTDTGDITFSNVNTYFDSNAGYGLQMFDGAEAGLKTVSGNILAEYDFVGNNYLYGTGLQVNGNTNAVSSSGNIYLTNVGSNQIMSAQNPSGGGFYFNVSGGGSGAGGGGNNDGGGLNLVACNSTSGNGGCTIKFWAIQKGQTANNATELRTNKTNVAEMQVNNFTYYGNGTFVADAVTIGNSSSGIMFKRSGTSGLSIRDSNDAGFASLNIGGIVSFAGVSATTFTGTSATGQNLFRSLTLVNNTLNVTENASIGKYLKIGTSSLQACSAAAGTNLSFGVNSTDASLMWCNTTGVWVRVQI